MAATNAGTDPSTAIADALLAVTVCDPACGSGHFLVAAARRIAKRLAAVREHNPEPTVEALRTALRDVVKHCIYGVDVNPMAVELAKVSLWLEALDPGKPLAFLDAHIKCGNALIGATPTLIDEGIPDKAFKPVEGDDPKSRGPWSAMRASLRRANADRQLPGQRTNCSATVHLLPVQRDLATELARIADAAGRLPARRAPPGRRLPGLGSRRKTGRPSGRRRLVCRLRWLKTKDAPPAIVNRVFRALREQGAAIPPATATEIERLREEYGFFHWHLEFPDIFRVAETAEPAADPDTGWSGGFTCVLANPPWDKVDFEDRSTSARSSRPLPPSGQKRRVRIAEWEREHPEEGSRYRAARRKVSRRSYSPAARGLSRMVREGLKAPGVNSLQTDHAVR